MKYYYSILFISLLLVSPLRAATVDFAENNAYKKFSIGGKCQGEKVTIQLFRNNNAMDYSAERPCADGSYELTDDFGNWQLPDGLYHILAQDNENLFATSTLDKQIIISESPIPPIETVETTIVETEENIAEEISATAEPNADSGFFGKILDWLIEWFKTALLEINELIAHKTTTDQLCLGATCIKEPELLNLLQRPTKDAPA